MRLTAIRLRNIVGETSTRAARLRVLVRTRFRSHVLFDGGRRHKELRAVAAGIDTGGDHDLEVLRDVLVDTASGAYAKGKEKLASPDLDADLVKAFRGLVNEQLLPSRQLMWTIHGPCRSFRFWSEDEQLTYVRFASEVVDVLRDLTPHVSLGFGSVLSVVRDRALIPHDDDLDLIIGFEPQEAATLADGLALVATFLTERGYAVRGNWSAHRQVRPHPQGQAPRHLRRPLRGRRHLLVPRHPRRPRPRHDVPDRGRRPPRRPVPHPGAPRDLPRAALRPGLDLPGPELRAPLGPLGLRRPRRSSGPGGCDAGAPRPAVAPVAD